MIPRLIEKYILSSLVSMQKIAYYFWRSYSGAEVDYLEKPISMPLKAYEFKYNGKSLSKGTKSFLSQYGIKVRLINKDNYLSFLR